MNALTASSTRKRHAEEVIRAQADPRFGVFSYREAVEAGFSSAQLNGRIQRGELRRLLPRTYAYSGYPDSWLQRAMAAQIWAGDTGALSGVTAARIWGLVENSEKTQVTVTKNTTSPRHNLIVRRIKEWRRGERVGKGPFVVTHVSRTLVDIATAVDEETLETALNIALHKRLVSYERLSRYVSSSPRGTKSLALVKQLLRERADDAAVPTNRFETKFLRLMRAADLPKPVAQFPIDRPNGRSAFIDFAYPTSMVAIETDGFASHGDYGAWARDRARRNELEALGWRVIHVTWRDLCERPDEVIALVRALLNPTMFA